MGALNGYIEEQYTAHAVVQAYGREQECIAGFAKCNEELRASGSQAQIASGILAPLVGFLGNAGYVAVAGLGAWLAIQGVLGIGDIQAFLRYLRQLNEPVSSAAGILNVLQSTVAAAERVFEVLEQEEEPQGSGEAILPRPSDCSVELEGVWFGYRPDAPVIKDMSLYARSGQQIALVGETGSGKTTIVNLLMRFYDVQQGAVKVAGQDIRSYRREELRSLFGMVLQDTWLFHGTILENIRYGRPNATDEEVVQAAKLACAHGFIQQLPGGYQFVLQEDAGNLSQGQCQLLTIARAILSNPAVLILDEATSSVDTRTELLIQQAMKNLMQGRTVFVIAHRLSTIRESDCILLLQGGSIAEQGTHEQLLRQGGAYAALYNSQFAE